MRKNKLSRFGEFYDKSAPAGLASAICTSIFLIAIGAAGSGGKAVPEYITAGFVIILGSLFVQACWGFSKLIPGIKSDFVSDYDREIIGRAFPFGAKKRLFFEGFELFRNDENDDALECFRELSGMDLSEREQGVLAFYTAVCYSRMGYSTNAGHQAVIAAEKDVQTPESLLMAARSFNLSASYAMASDCYEKLLPIAEERGMFPFLYNEMGKMYLSANDPAKSRIYFNKAVENGLDPITAHGGLALVSLLEGKEDEACERYRLALIARISDANGYKEYCTQICTANGYPENFLEEHLRERYRKGK